jgi:hypothetical protein
LRQPVKTGSVCLELAVDEAELPGRVAGSRVDDVHEHASPLQVGQELVPEARAFGRPLDQAGHIGDHELAAVGRIDRAEHGLQRREGVVRHLRSRIRDPSQQGRLACIGKADERSICEEFEAKLKLCLLPIESDLGEAWGLPRRRREAAIAPAAVAAAGDDDAATHMREVGDKEAVLVDDLRAHGNTQLGITTGCPVLTGAASMTSSTTREQAPGPEAREVAQIGVGEKDDVASVAAVAAVGPSLRNVLLPPEAQRAVAPAARPHCNAGAVVEHAASASRRR